MNHYAPHKQRQKKTFDVRRANALVCALLIIFFVFHVIIGTVLWYGALGMSMALVAWAGVGLVAIHLILSIVTTALGVKPPEHYAALDQSGKKQPSRRSKHVLKWITGLLMISLLILHLTVGDLVGNLHYTKGALVALILLILIGIHVYIDIKSFTRDLNLSPRTRVPFQVGVIFFCAFMATIFLLVSL